MAPCLGDYVFTEFSTGGNGHHMYYTNDHQSCLCRRYIPQEET